MTDITNKGTNQHPLHGAHTSLSKPLDTRRKNNNSSGDEIYEKNKQPDTLGQIIKQTQTAN